MSKVKDMSLKDIFALTDVMFTSADILDFCDDQETINGYLDRYDEKNFRTLEEYLIQNEDKIDKEKLVFCLYLNYKSNLANIEDNLVRLSKNVSQNWKEIKELLTQQGIQKQNMRVTENLVKNIDTYLSEAETENGKIKFDILSSKEELKNRKIAEKRKLERWNYMDRSVEGEENITIYILQPLLLTDICSILPDKQLGLKLREAILINAVLNEKQMSFKQLSEIRIKDFAEYADLIDNANPQFYLPELKEVLVRNIRFVDIDKLLLICAYRFEEHIERRETTKEDQETIKICMDFIRDNIENKNLKMNEILDDLDTYDPIEVKYSFSDITKCIERFVGDTYIPKSRIKQAKDDLLIGSITLDNLETPLFNLIELNNDEINEIMCYSLENFAYGVEMMNFNSKQIEEKLRNHPEIICIDLLSYLYSMEKTNMNLIIQFYNDGLIDAEFFKEFSEENDISSEINLQKINEQYNIIKKQQKPPEEDIKKLDGMIALYKIINLEQNSEEELQEASDNLMYELAENFEEEADILFYYQNGLITLNTVAEWGGDSLVEQLYNESKITSQDLENLYNNRKINQKLIEKIVLENQDIDYTELMRCIYSGYISENKIIDFYMQGKIFDTDLEEITRQGRISILTFKEATSKRTKETLEEAAQIKLEPTLVNIPDKKIQVNVLDETSTSTVYKTNSRTKTLIDPNARYELLTLLGAKKANAIIPDEENAFYNYEFFVIPNEEGKLDVNSVVIAERFYKDKEYKDEFAVDNATYFFQYKDMMVNSNLKKKEMSQDRENIVFTASHRPGSWAVSVLYRIAQTRASSNFKEYKKGDERAGRVIDELLKIYSQQQLKMILDMTGRIDDTNEFIYEEVNSSYSQQKKKHVNNGEVDDGEANNGER